MNCETINLKKIVDSFTVTWYIFDPFFWKLYSSLFWWLFFFSIFDNWHVLNFTWRKRHIYINVSEQSHIDVVYYKYLLHTSSTVKWPFDFGFMWRMTDTRCLTRIKKITQSKLQKLKSGREQERRREEGEGDCKTW